MWLGDCIRRADWIPLGNAHIYVCWTYWLTLQETKQGIGLQPWHMSYHPPSRKAYRHINIYCRREATMQSPQKVLMKRLLAWCECCLSVFILCLKVASFLFLSYQSAVAVSSIGFVLGKTSLKVNRIEGGFWRVLLGCVKALVQEMSEVRLSRFIIMVVTFCDPGNWIGEPGWSTLAWEWEFEQKLAKLASCNDYSLSTTRQRAILVLYLVMTMEQHGKTKLYKTILHQLLFTEGLGSWLLKRFLPGGEDCVEVLNFTLTLVLRPCCLGRFKEFTVR